MNCKCFWEKSGLGAQVLNPHSDCQVHGVGGPLPMFNATGVPFAGAHDHAEKVNPPRRGIPLTEVATVALFKMLQKFIPSDRGSEYVELERRLRAVEKAEQGRDYLKLIANLPEFAIDSRAFGNHMVGFEEPTPEKKFGNHQNDEHLDKVSQKMAAPGEPDDRHAFSSGAMSSGKKPDYAEIFDRCTLLSLQRLTAQRRYGDNKYGKDNWKKGAQDKEFILDRINHVVEHALNLHKQVLAGDPGNWRAGEDDAAALMCGAMFVMQFQWELRREQERKKQIQSGLPSQESGSDSGSTDRSSQG